jgi:hypothetical protein
VSLRGVRYCRTECLERGLSEILGSTQALAQPVSRAAHRVPLGLLLLSRQQLTADQLRAALDAQRESVRNEGPNSRSKKIGVWLQEMGFVTEPQVTAALARQWSCPVLQAPAMAITANRFPPIPALLLESFQMIPVELVESTGNLLMAFSQGIDYSVLYAIEQMLGYHTEACLVSQGTLQKSLQALARRRGAGDVVFDRTKDAAECVRIIGSYSAKVRAEEVRVTRCGDHLWVRLERPRQDAVTLLLRAPETSAPFPVLSSQS